MSVSQYYTSLFDVHISKNQSHLTTTILSLPVPSKHLKGQLGPASVTSRFWMKARQLGPASVTSHFLDQSTSVGARFCNVTFFGSKQVSWIPLSVTSGFWTKADWIPLLGAFHKCKKKESSDPSWAPYARSETLRTHQNVPAWLYPCPTILLGLAARLGRLWPSLHKYLNNYLNNQCCDKPKCK